MTEKLTPIPPDLAPHFAWVREPAVVKVVGALTDREAGSVRFVGGCVRDSLLGETPKDIDIATTQTPDQVIAALKRAHLGAAPTGLDHGTVTAIADHKGIEVTTLRADVSTDGRRATVAFTRDWEIDARRRDFTVNALYLTPSLELFDPVGGMADLAARRVRFIGEAEDRIREDFLRILRFFRFSARYAQDFDAVGLKACSALKEGVNRLSAERVGDEMTKLLALPAPQGAVKAMAASGVLGQVWPEAPQIESLARLKAIDPSAAAPLALAALYGPKGDGLDARLRLSNAQGSQRRFAVENSRLIDFHTDEIAARALLYRLGAGAWRDACLVAEADFLARTNAPSGRDPAFQSLRALPERWTPPRLPFSGKDALRLGVPEGPPVASVIKAAEARWIDEDFPPRERAIEIFEEEAARAISTG
ncbi:MAG: CCA tRNA nucleotidyltransferase [Pseudomonadota bacterium]